MSKNTIFTKLWDFCDFYLKKLDEKYDRNVGMLWDDNLFPVRFKDFSIHEVSSGHISREFIALDSDKQIRKVLFERNSIRDPRFYYSSKNRRDFKDYNSKIAIFLKIITNIVS